MGVIRWEDEQHSFLRAGWLQALSRLPTITHSIPNTHTDTHTKVLAHQQTTPPDYHSAEGHVEDEAHTLSHALKTKNPNFGEVKWSVW